MRGAVQLTLMIGPAVPMPVPRSVLDALTSVRVSTFSGDLPSGFELNFSLGKNSPLNTLFLISGGAGIPLLRVLLIVTMNGTPTVLIDGVMTHHQVQPGAGGAPSTLRVQGKDKSTVMSYLDFDGVPYPAMPPEARALIMIAKYAWLGLIPVVIPSIIPDLPIPIERIPRHIGTDLEYIKLIARQSGYVFYIDSGPAPGVSIAYWGPEIRVGAPQPALNIDMDAHTNVDSISFRYDKEAKEMPVIFIQEPTTKAPIPIPIPDITPLNPPLGVIPPLPPKLKFLKATAKMSPLQAAMTGLAYASQHADAVFASGTLDVVRYGRVLKSRQLVGVRGAGAAYDGLYYVKSVGHSIERGQYKQSFELARNGLLSTIPKVPA
ncbi:MAG: hypothetical protein ABWY00_11920 [Dongiaceae bacterium]